MLLDLLLILCVALAAQANLGGAPGNCDKACLKKWPAFHAAAKAKAEGDWTLVKAADGKEMWAYEGKPLYMFVDDKMEGDMKGDGMGGVWHVAK